jgi:hypothetical protein
MFDKFFSFQNVFECREMPSAVHGIDAVGKVTFFGLSTKGAFQV